MIYAKYIVNLKQAYKLVKLLDKFAEYIEHVRYRTDTLDGKLIAEVLVPTRAILGEFERRLKHVRDCDFSMVSIENNRDDFDGKQQ